MAFNPEAPRPRRLFSRKEAIRLIAVSALAGALGCTPQRTVPAPENPAPPQATESPTIPPPPKATEIQKPSPSPSPEAKPGPEFTPKIVDGLETWGQDKPFTKEELKQLEAQLNSKPSEMETDTYYGTFFIEKSVYDGFSREAKESYQAYLIRHEQVYNRILSEGDTQTKIKFRRLVIMAPDSTLAEGEFRRNLKDSDGGWDFFETASPYFPKKSAYYNESTKIDSGLLHEIGHSVLHLPDNYSLDFSNPGANAVSDLPPQWKSYSASHRMDIGKDTMASAGFVGINKHTQLQLKRRLPGNIHDQEYIKEAAWAHPYEVPETVYLNFGRDLSGSQVTILRSHEIEKDKRPSHFTRKKDLAVIGNYPIGPDGRVKLSKDQLFAAAKNGMIDDEDSTFLLRFGGGQGKKYLRWMDIRDFNIAHWLGHTDAVSMKIKGATSDDRPEGFDWKIEYSKP